MERAARAPRRRASVRPRGGGGDACARSLGEAAPNSSATSTSSRRRRSRRSRARTAVRSSSSPSRRSTRPAAARSPTPARSSARTATAARDVADVRRVGDDQVGRGRAERGPLEQGERVARARRPRRAPRHAGQPHRDAPAARGAARAARHPRAPGRLVRRPRQAALRLHPRPAPDAPRSCAQVEDRVNEWILRNDPVRPITTTLDEARALGAMALFGEKYGDVVRMVEIGDGSYSRELCGGTHVRSTAEIGVFKILTRDLQRGERAAHRGGHRPRGASRCCAATTRVLREAAPRCASRPRRSPSAVADAASARPSRRRRRAQRRDGAVDVAALAERAARSTARACSPRSSRRRDAKALLDARRPREGQARRRAAIVLGTAVDGRVAPRRGVAPALVERGVKAGEVVKVAAQVAGGGGGGRDTMAQAGGRDPTSSPRRSPPPARRSSELARQLR